jgi:hypothetical protein
MAFSQVSKSPAIDWYQKSVGAKTMFDEMDTDAEPQLQVGSIVEVSGELYELDTSALSATGWAGIATSTQAYIYVVPSGSTASIIYSSTAPTWTPTKRGYYNGNDKAVLAVFKDAAGTGYVHKQKLLGRNVTTGGTTVASVTNTATSTWEYSSDFIVYESGSYYTVMSSTAVIASSSLFGVLQQKVNGTYTNVTASAEAIRGNRNVFVYITSAAVNVPDAQFTLAPGTYRLAMYTGSDLRTGTLYRAGRLSNDD